MLDFDAGKLVVVGVVALVVIGPKELPRVLRQVGQTVAKVRRMAAEFQSQFMDAMREAEMADVKEEMSKIAETAKIDVAFDPVRDIRNQIGGAIEGETEPHGATSSAPTASLADLDAPTNSVDLSALQTVSSLTGGDAATDGIGLVGAGTAPAGDVAAAPPGETHVGDVPGGEPIAEAGLVATGIAPIPDPTLDDVRQALTKGMNAAPAFRPDHEHPVKETAA